MHQEFARADAAVQVAIYGDSMAEIEELEAWVTSRNIPVVAKGFIGNASGEELPSIPILLRSRRLNLKNARDFLRLRGRRIPVVLVTDWCTAREAFQVAQMGYHDLVLWPVDKGATSEIAAHAWEHWRQADEKADNSDYNHLPLTNRQMQVLQGILKGSPNKQIATSLSVSVKTIEYHRSQIMKKLCVNSVAELIQLVLRKEKS